MNTLSLSISHSIHMALYIPLLCLFPIPIEHTLTGSIPPVTGSPPTVHSITSSIHAVLRLLGKHFPVMSHSVTFITRHSLIRFQHPYLANYFVSVLTYDLPLWCPNRVQHPNIQLMRITFLRGHDSN